MKYSKLIIGIGLVGLCALVACNQDDFEDVQDIHETAEQTAATTLELTLQAEQVPYDESHKRVQKTFFGKKHDMVAIGDGNYAVGDMIFTEEYIQQTNDAIQNKGVFDRRVSKWPNRTLVYWHPNNIPQFMKDRISQAAQEITQYTDLNVRFYRNGDKHYVNINYNANNPCNAVVGYLRNTNQNISSQSMNLGSNCSKGTVMHEMLHSAGMHHEQNHWNRDTYIQIWYQSIVDNQEYNWTKISNADGGEYSSVPDRTSIMMYGSTSWQTPQARNNGWWTMAWKEPNGGYSEIIPRRESLSQGDLNAINWWY